MCLGTEPPEEGAFKAGRRGVNIEGLAVKGGRFFFGFRGPAIDRTAKILAVDAKVLLDGGDANSTLSTIRVGKGRAIRDLQAVSDGILVLAGPTMTLPTRIPAGSCGAGMVRIPVAARLKQSPWRGSNSTQCNCALATRSSSRKRLRSRMHRRRLTASSSSRTACAMVVPSASRFRVECARNSVILAEPAGPMTDRVYFLIAGRGLGRRTYPGAPIFRVERPPSCWGGRHGSE
jgi:Protein of unknown function (DUF3616)